MRVQGISFLLLSTFICLLVISICFVHVQSSVLGERESVRMRKQDWQQVGASNSEEEQNVNVMNPRVVFPMVISKRSATALGKLMQLIRTSMDHPGGKHVASSRERKEPLLFPTSSLSANYELSSNINGVQRRNQKNNYLRCYFNAVSCF